MPTKPLSRELAQEALDAAEIHGGVVQASRVFGVNKETMKNRHQKALLMGLKPTARKDAPRIYERQRLGRMHMVIPDVQSKPGVRNEHL